MEAILRFVDQFTCGMREASESAFFCFVAAIALCAFAVGVEVYLQVKYGKEESNNVQP